jgi:hypothetical protein
VRGADREDELRGEFVSARGADREGRLENYSDHWRNSDIPTKKPRRGRGRCCGYSNRRTAKRDYQRERRNGADVKIYPNRRRSYN